MLMFKQCLAGFFFWILCEGFTSTCSNCKRCVQDRHCTKCESGYFIDKWKCKKCPDKCKRCVNAQTCTQCYTGLYGHTCEKECFKCENNVCNIYDGICKFGCSNTSEYSVKVKNGYRCYKCIDNCKICKPGNELDCYKCKNGYWGNFCQHKCPPDCHKASCKKLDRRCRKESTVSLYIGNGYISRGHDACHEMCLENVTNHCCSQCNIGYWGQTCKTKCGENCMSLGCNKLTGQCNKEGEPNNLKNNVSFTQCPTFCENCSSSDVCDICQPGKYGDKCDKLCRHGFIMVNNTCSIELHKCTGGEYLSANGLCSSCKPGCSSCTSLTQCLEYHANYSMTSSNVSNACQVNCTDDTCVFEECRSQHDVMRTINDFHPTALYTIVGSGVGLAIVLIIVAIKVVLYRCRHRRAPMSHQIRGEL